VDPSELRSGASNSEEYEATFGHQGAGGISPQHASRIADEVMAHDKKYGSAREDDKGVIKPGGARRNRHLDGFGGRNNA
jgi:hypothetical protein